MDVVIGDFRAIEVVDADSRPAVAERFRGEDVRSGVGVCMTVLSADRADGVASAVSEVDHLQHQHLVPLQQVVVDGDRMALICRWPPGGRLAELLSRRQRLSAGEVLTVLIPLAGVLSAVHAAGVRHGGIDPSEIWFDRSGRPMLGAIGVAHVVAAAGDGLPAGLGDVAPEVVRDERRSAAAVGPAADVFSLGSVALRCLVGRSAWPADDPADVLVQSAAGLWPDLPDDAGPPALVTLLRAMLSADPAKRPTAAEVASRLDAVGAPAPVGFGPVRAGQSASRWNGRGGTGPRAGHPAEPAGQSAAEPDGPSADSTRDSASGAAVAGTRKVARPGRRARSSQAQQDRPAAERAAVPAGTGAGPDAAPRVPTRLARAGIAVLTGLLALVVAVQIGLWLTDGGTPDAAQGDVVGSNDTVVVTADDWVQVVADLDGARGRALATADVAVLGEVYLPESAPALADAGTIGELAARGWTVLDGVHEITSVSVDPVGGSLTPDPWVDPSATVRLVVVDSLPARPIVDGAGREVGRTAARGEQQRILTLTPTVDGYRISAIEPG